MIHEEKRRSDRVIPVITEEEAVLVATGGDSPTLAKLIDFSELGTLVYLLVKTEFDLPIGDVFALTMYDRGKMFELPGRVVRKSGHLVGFEFADLADEGLRSIRAKLIRMEVEWLRLNRSST